MGSSLQLHSPMKQEFEMTEEDLEVILDACKPVPWFAPGGYWPKTPQENANAAWALLGEKMGFDYDTVEPIPGKSQNFFLAVPLIQA